MIELLIYIFIMTSMLLLTSQFAVNTIRGQQEASQVQRMYQTVRQTVAAMNYDLRSAQSIVSASSVFDTDSSVLAFVDANGNNVTYRLATSTIERQSSTVTEAITSNDVRAEKFRLTYLSYPDKYLEAVRVSMTFSSGVEGTNQFYRQSFVTGITLRP